MALIDSASEQTILLENHLFYLPSTATERRSTHDFEIGPSQAVNPGSGDLLFTVPASTNEFISLADMRLCLDLVVKRPNGMNFDETTDTVAPINNILHSLFQSVSVSLNGRCITDSSQLYFMRAYLESLLGFTGRTQDSQLTCAGWYKNENFQETFGTIAHNAGDPAAVPPILPTTAVLVPDAGARLSRQMLFKGSPIQLSGKIFSCIFQQDKPLLTGVEMTIHLVRSKTALAFCAETDAELPIVEIRNPRLKVRKFEPNPVFLASVAKTLLTRTVKYHLERICMRQLTLTPGVQHSVWSNLAIGQLPKTLILGLVSNTAFSGTARTSPYNFHHFNMQHISCEIDGVMFPSRGYNMDYASHNSLSAYEGLLDCLERLNESNGELSFDRYGYNEGFTLYGFDFTTSHTGRGALSLIKHGNLNVTFRFQVPLPETVVCIAMLCFDNILEIDNNRRLIYDFAP
jgi:hypothetical protein